MPYFPTNRFAAAMLLAALPLFSSAQCPATTDIDLAHVYPYSAWIFLNPPNIVSHVEYEIVPLGQPFTGQPGGTLDYYEDEIPNLEPNTTYAWRVRSVCGSGPGAWGASPDTFTTPPPCPPALILALDSTLSMSFPAPNSENIGFYVCDYETDSGFGSYLWGFKAAFSAYFRLQVTGSGGNMVYLSVNSGAHPDCGGNGNCLSNGSPTGTKYDFYLQAGDSIYFKTSYPFNNGPTWRTVKITERPCPPATGIKVDSITLTSARLDFNDNQLMDIEFVPENEAFTGVPNYPAVSNFLTLDDLTAGTGYKWQIRSNCLPQNAGAWQMGLSFETAPVCDSIPLIPCDSILNIHLKAGKSGLIYPDFDLYDDRKVLLKYRPVRSDFLRVTVNQSSPLISFNISVRDSALADCDKGSWPLGQGFYNVPETKELAYLSSGHTYYLLVSHDDNSYGNANLQLNLHCPDICPRPFSLSDTLIQQTKATLRWQNNEQSNAYELELRPLAEAFTGTPNYNGSGNSRQVTGLQALREYHWRIRNVCTGGVASTWSDSLSFTTYPNCLTGPQLNCGDTMTVSHGPGLNFLTTCSPYHGGEGTERYFRFVPPYSGVYMLDAWPTVPYGPVFGYLLKGPDADCSAEGWTCLGGGVLDISVSMGYLEAGETYILAVDRPEYNDPAVTYKTRFVISCIGPTCVPPANLSATNVDHESAILQWQKLSTDLSWEIELVPQGQSFTGTPNYFAALTSLPLDGLQALTTYQWRVRALCGAFGQSDWSATATFKTTINCDLFPPLQCGQMIDLPFPAGAGYYENMANCLYSTSGSEVVLSFTVDDNSTTRQLYFPQTGNLSQLFIYQKDAGAGACPGAGGTWTCVVAGSSNPVANLTNLVPGHTYHILIKKSNTTSAFSVPMAFYCDLPCDLPGSPSTQISPGMVKLLWNVSPGPWHFEIALAAVNGPYNTLNLNVANGANALGWATLQADSLYDWQVRRICNSGDTSAWVPGPRFRVPFNCLDAIPLGCEVSAVLDFPAAADYDFENACTGSTDIGQFQLYKITPGLTGQHLLRINSAAGTPFHYALTQSPANCSSVPLPWGSCQDLAAPGDFSLGNLNANQTYYLQVSKTGVAPGTQDFQLLCPCPAVTGAQGILYADGSVTFNWTASAGVASWEIEVVPVDSLFDGSDTYETTAPPMIVAGLDASVSYKFRIRTLCTGTSGAWTNPTEVYTYPNCLNFPILACGDTLLLDIANGNGLFNHQPCGQSTPGREAYLKIQPSYTGVHNLKILSAVGTGHFGWLSDCADPNSDVACISSSLSEGTFNLGYLQAGETYTIVVDCKFSNGGTYLLTLGCDLPPANDNYIWWPGVDYVIAVNDSCQVFTNSFATPNPSEEPDPSQAPGNWYDGPEHSVWFVFTAPPGGTVQITAQSDPGDPMDPQIALLQLDSAIVPWTFVVLATGEDQPGLDSQNAVLNFTGLIPGEIYAVLVDGAYNSEGRFCLKITDEPLLSASVGICESYTKTASANSVSDWINLYAENDNPHLNGPLLAALKTADNLGAITVSTEILPQVPVLSGGQKIIPRYFNIDTEFAPQNPVQVRLFFTPADLVNFNLAPPVSSVSPADLSITHYDGGSEDCNPANNVLPGGGLAVQPADAVFVGENGLFYLETTVSSFSELGAALPTVVVGTQAQVSEIGIQIFPNPFSEQFELHLHAAHAAILQGELRNMTGQSVWARDILVAPGNSRQTIALEKIPPGAYQLSLNQDGRSVGRALVVKI